MSITTIQDVEFIQDEQRLLVRPTLKGAFIRFVLCLIGAALVYGIGQAIAGGAGDMYKGGRLVTGAEREELNRNAEMVLTGLSLLLISWGVYLITGWRRPFLLWEDGRLERGRRVFFAAGAVSYIQIHKQEADGGLFSVRLVGKDGQVSPVLFKSKSEEDANLAATEIGATVDLSVLRLGMLDCQEEADRLTIKDTTLKSSYRGSVIATLFFLFFFLPSLWPMLNFLPNRGLGRFSLTSFDLIFTIFFLLIGLLLLAACFSHFRSLAGNIVKWRQGGPVYVLERSTDLLKCNSKTIGRLRDIQQVEIETVATGDETSVDYTYGIVLRLTGKKRVQIGGRYSKATDAEEVAKKIATFANVELQHTQKHPVSITVGTG